jgi:hypothetical protein
MTVGYSSAYLRGQLEALTSVARHRELPYLCDTDARLGSSGSWSVFRCETQGPFECCAPRCLIRRKMDGGGGH